MTAGACFFGLAFILYFASGVLYLGGLFDKGLEGGPRWARVLARGAFTAHTVALFLHGLAVHHAPFTDAWESLSFFAWSLTLFFLALEWRTPQPGVGAFVMPLGFLALFFASAQPTSAHPPLDPLVQNHALKLHIAVCLMGYGSFALAFCVALVYLFHERRLKRKEIGGRLLRLLPLEQADLLANRLVALGFALLTLGLLMGVNFALRDWTGAWWLDPKVISSFLLWLLYGLYLYSRIVGGWRGRRTMLLLALSFVVLLSGYIGVNMSGLGRHIYPF